MRSFSLQMKEAMPAMIDGSDGISSDVDGLAGNVIFCAWTGNNPMSSQRAEALMSIYKQTCCPVLFLTQGNISQWEIATSPFHPAYTFLSETHKADYLRCYLMHHFGGGYTDLKVTQASWMSFFARLRDSRTAYGLGYQEIGANGVAPCGGALEQELRANYGRLIGNCAYIFRKQTAFTARWLGVTHRLLDLKLEALQRHPAQHPMDQQGLILPDGTVSLYPLRWQEILGELFHPLVYEFKDRLLQAEIAPRFWGYR